MTPAALALVLGAAVAHAAWNVIAKTAPGGGVGFVWLSAAAAAALLTPPGVVLAVLSPPPAEALGFAAGSGVLHAAYYTLLQRGYRDGELSLVYPLARGTGPVLAIAGAMILLGERPGALALAGAAMIVAAVL
ncbi:MAG: DMT family transporter, partial [Thermoleophilaceae bacterium]